MDDDDREPEDAAVEPARDAAQEEGAKLREVSEEKLQQSLAAHETWLEKGKQADLSRTDLQGANLAGANLHGADLTDANLTGAETLTPEPLEKACGDDDTQFPDYLADYQMKPCQTPAQSPSN